MLMKFNDLIDNLYDRVISTKDSMRNFKMIKRCKFFLGLKQEDFFSTYYYRLISDNKKGVVYTPSDIALFMIESTIKEEFVLEHPCCKILDPSCGSGNILLPLFTYLYKIFKNNIDYINRKHHMNLTEKNIGEHIIKNNIFGIDIDETALKILVLELYLKSGVVSLNLHKYDFLMDNIESRFNIVIGNPPYLSTKLIEKDYSKRIRSMYNEVYYDKGDLSYCFFKKALEIVEEQYKITYITSRYFLEALHGDNLRSFLINRTNVEKIVDYYGVRPFKTKGIDPLIIFLSSTSVEKIEINRPIKNSSKIVFNKIYINKSQINSEPWRLIDNKDLEIINKIEGKCNYKLSDISKTYQGIITGCDKAFIVNNEIINKFNIEKSLLRPWIKSSDLRCGEVENRNSFIIYSDIIYNEDEYPYAIAYISRYKEKLSARRECKNARKKWYELQWGRKIEIFENEKIIFPYKSKNSRFIIDKGNYYSADIYSLIIKENLEISLEELNKLLNSTIYEFYFKSFAKKLGGDLYEYYPNNINRLMIPIDKNMNLINENDIFEYFQFTTEEQKYIKVSTDRF